jgi:DNA-binding GntR family transcriptional regulator
MTELTVSADNSRAKEQPSGHSLSDRVLVDIQRRIVTGEIPLGSWLRHEALAEAYGVSRTPIREVLRVLESRGVVEIVRHRGARVKGPSARDLRELGEVRAELEGYAAALAAERIRDAELRALHDAWRAHRDVIAKVVDGAGEKSATAAERWAAANQTFHTTIHQAAGNAQLRVMIDDLHQRLPRNITYAAISGDSYLLRRNVEEHDAITEAIARRDSSDARQAMTAHILASTGLITRWFERQPDLGNPMPRQSWDRPGDAAASG